MPDPDPNVLDPELLRRLAALVRVDLSPERTAALVTQAEPHFALLRVLDPLAPPGTEPAAEFRLDSWVRRGNA